MSWVIAIPAWGDRCIPLLRGSAIPSVQAALKYAGNPPARFVIHTDEPGRLADIAATHKCEIRRLPQVRHSRYYTLSDCHREAIEYAKPGEFVALINADHVVSREIFMASERVLHAGKRLVMMCGTRTLQSDVTPQPVIGVSSRDLLSWAWDNRHQTMEDAIWGTGKSTSLSMLYFVNQTQSEVISRCFHLHPFAFVKQPELKFKGLTVDEDLADAWPKELIHVVTKADEAALIEQSPPDFRFKSHTKRFGIRDIAFWANGDNGRGGSRATELHRWLFTKRIVIRGHGANVGDRAVCEAILSVIPDVRAA